MVDRRAAPASIRRLFVRRQKGAGARPKGQIGKSGRSGTQVRQRVLRLGGTAISNAPRARREGLARLISEGIPLKESRPAAWFSPNAGAALLEPARRVELACEPCSMDLADGREESRVAIGVREVGGTADAPLGGNRRAPALLNKVHEAALHQRGPLPSRRPFAAPPDSATAQDSEAGRLPGGGVGRGFGGARPLPAPTIARSLSLGRRARTAVRDREWRGEKLRTHWGHSP